MSEGTSLDVQLSLVKGATGFTGLTMPVILDIQIEQIKQSPNGKLLILIS